MWKPKWLEEREREQLRADKARDRAAADPAMDACAIAYANHRLDGGSTDWETFRRGWFTRRDKMPAGPGRSGSDATGTAPPEVAT